VRWSSVLAIQEQHDTLAGPETFQCLADAMRHLGVRRRGRTSRCQAVLARRTQVRERDECALPSDGPAASVANPTSEDGPDPRAQRGFASEPPIPDLRRCRDDRVLCDILRVLPREAAPLCGGTQAKAIASIECHHGVFIPSLDAGDQRRVRIEIDSRQRIFHADLHTRKEGVCDDSTNNEETRMAVQTACACGSEPR
jgi:hypothetical protein